MRRRLFLLAAGAGAGALLGVAGRSARGSPQATRLRPPGAGEEADFLAACIRCGQCVSACPIDVLHLEGPEGVTSAGTPWFDSRTGPCNLCGGEETMRCIEACPTTALTPVADVHDVTIGRAFLDEERCLARNDVVCRTCWHVCPLPNEAVRLGDDLKPKIKACHCVGCGLCDQACPTEPSSIEVVPKGGRRRGRRGAGP